MKSKRVIDEYLRYQLEHGRSRDVLTTQQVASKLSVSADTIRRWVAQGLPHASMKILGFRRNFFDLRTVVAWRKSKQPHAKLKWTLPQ